MTDRRSSTAALYERNAEWWARQRATTRFPERKFLERILDGLQPGETVLDLGCGSGHPIAAFLLERGMNVTGVDASSAMIELASKSLPSGEWLVADMTSLDLKRKFGAIVAWDSFFHLEVGHQRDMFPRFRGHLRPGGLLLFTSGPKHGEAIGDLNGEPLYHASLAPEEYRELFTTHGFEELSFVAEDPTCGGHTVWLCRAAAA